MTTSDEANPVVQMMNYLTDTDAWRVGSMDGVVVVYAPVRPVLEGLKKGLREAGLPEPVELDIVEEAAGGGHVNYRWRCACGELGPWQLTRAEAKLGTDEYGVVHVHPVAERS